MVLRLPRSCKRNNFVSNLSVKSELWRPRFVEAKSSGFLWELGSPWLQASLQLGHLSIHQSQRTQKTPNSPVQHLLSSGGACSKHRGQCQTVNIQSMALQSQVFSVATVGGNTSSHPDAVKGSLEQFSGDLEDSNSSTLRWGKASLPAFHLLFPFYGKGAAQRVLQFSGPFLRTQLQLLPCPPMLVGRSTNTGTNIPILLPSTSNSLKCH